MRAWVGSCRARQGVFDNTVVSLWRDKTTFMLPTSKPAERAFQVITTRLRVGLKLESHCEPYSRLASGVLRLHFSAAINRAVHLLEAITVYCAKELKTARPSPNQSHFLGRGTKNLLIYGKRGVLKLRDLLECADKGSARRPPTRRATDIADSMKLQSPSNHKTLRVPYLTQPTSNTCQSTCLKMYSMYLHDRLAMSSAADGMSILDIWKEINEGTERPSKGRNSYENMAWWLGKYFPSYNFSVSSTRNPDEAMMAIVDQIDRGFPVMVSTNHSRTDGHIILVIGYRGAVANQCAEVQFVCHDPYGKFNPKLGAAAYGKKRFDRGQCLEGGGEVGPGMNVVYDHDGIRRIRSDKHSNGTYFMISGST